MFAYSTTSLKSGQSFYRFQLYIPLLGCLLHFCTHPSPLRDKSQVFVFSSQPQELGNLLTLLQCISLCDQGQAVNHSKLHSHHL